MGNVSNNPKLAAGSRKQGFNSVPPSAFVYLAQAMDNGAEKYGNHNWRESEVIASIYADAAMRHLLSWIDGEDVADDSGVEHLAHVMACCAIVLDAKRLGRLKDDRHTPGDFAEFIKSLEKLSPSQERTPVEAYLRNDIAEAYKRAMQQR